MARSAADYRAALAELRNAAPDDKPAAQARAAAEGLAQLMEIPAGPNRTAFAQQLDTQIREARGA